MIGFVEFLVLIFVACRWTLTNAGIQIMIPNSYRTPSEYLASVVGRGKATLMTVRPRAMSRIQIDTKQEWLGTSNGSAETKDGHTDDRTAESSRKQSSYTVHATQSTTADFATTRPSRRFMSPVAHVNDEHFQDFLNINLSLVELLFITLLVTWLSIASLVTWITIVFH
ncbi:uncharacterized protein LOC112681751 isoform X2 [Sipha flava]|uniref:Uncharacterized protein LOC112681751 isoform X2 n=1 Tax=Sipha flava TaxID=143950 RepID=A0A8B8FB58_9HEMI|nr:uncharacterized protein LOC112681751 isoform X2 [Sipha flava]